MHNFENLPDKKGIHFLYIFHKDVNPM